MGMYRDEEEPLQFKVDYENTQNGPGFQLDMRISRMCSTGSIHMR